jgi:hypothetical protein
MRSCCCSHILMATRPQTLYVLADSPVCLAAWLFDHGDGYGQPAAPISSSHNDARIAEDTIMNIPHFAMSSIPQLRPPTGYNSEGQLHAKSKVAFVEIAAACVDRGDYAKSVQVRDLACRVQLQ